MQMSLELLEIGIGAVLHAKKFKLRRLISALLAVFIATGGALAGLIPSLAVDGIAAIANASYTEQADPVQVAPALALTDANDYAGASVQAAINSRDATETLSLIEDDSASTTLGAVSIVDGDVYVGDGSSAEIVGQVAAGLDGSGGTLKVNFASSFDNADFEGGNTNGWTLINTRVDLGVTQIAGYTTEDTTSYGSVRCASNDNASVTGNFNGSELIASANSNVDVAANGDWFLRLVSSDVRGPSGYVTHGPAVYSDIFTASQGQTLGFDWRAAFGSDNYHVYAALLSVDDSPPARWTEILDATGVSTNWATKSITVPFDGQYRFVFVSGTDDASCGTVAGASKPLH